MEKSASFSGKEVESVSLDFSQLREQGIAYVQKLSRDTWTDYNSHDPGVTILEQLCYSLTDLAYRTSLPVKDLLTTENDVQPDPEKNAFIPPSSILTTHPVTIDDTRKMIIDQFDEIQNVWMTTKSRTGFEEALSGINRIEILPKINFLKSVVGKPEKKLELKNRVNVFLNQNRNIGEYYKKAILLEPQDITIKFKVYFGEDIDLEDAIAGLFVKLLEYIYIPVKYSSFNEMKQAGYSLEETFSGPKMERGFIKDERLKYASRSFSESQLTQNDIHENRLKSIHIDELQKIISKSDHVTKCKVEPFDADGKQAIKIEVKERCFFHLLQIDQSSNIIDNKFDRIYKNMTVFVNEKELTVLNVQRINSLFSEVWSKKHRAYPIGSSDTECINNQAKGIYRKPIEYYSLQRHFPLIYGIGEEGLSKNEPAERHVQALQLKAYLMLFEQHLANHLSQLGNLNEFFNIKFTEGKGKTYFAQRMDSVPQIEKLSLEDRSDIESYLESKSTFYNRKNRIYNHLLARFGEDISDIPWKVALRLKLISDEDEFNRILLMQKSNFLQKLEKLSYYRTRGECFSVKHPETEIPVWERNSSGLEQIILAKTGIPDRGERKLVPDLIELNEPFSQLKESNKLREVGTIEKNFRPLLPNEIKNDHPKGAFINVPVSMFKELDIKVLYRETLNYRNYRISVSEPDREIQVIFQKEKNRWVNLFTATDREKAIQKIKQIRSYFLAQNNRSEGLYVVDHILLSDLLTGSQYGFKFIDYDVDSTVNPKKKISEKDFILFQTLEDESWCKTKEERNKRVEEFYRLAKAKCSYQADGNNWLIKNAKGDTIATCKHGIHNTETNESGLINLNKKTRSLIQLFNGSEKTNGRLRFKELEKIRAKGSMDSHFANYRQRRLVFQRKLANGKVIDEDFFDLSITVLIPDWPARFQIERFKDYVTELIHERTPSHISNEILWLDAVNLKHFEAKYQDWEQLRFKSGQSGSAASEIQAAALEVYQSIQKIKRK